MSTDTATEPKRIPTRSDINPRFTWDLSHIYASIADWETAFARCRSLSNEASGFVGTLGMSADRLFACLELRGEVHLLIGRLYQYAHLGKDLDTRVATFQELTDRAAMLGAEAGAAFAFVEPELLALDETRLRNLATQFPDTTRYDFYIRELIRSKEHVRSAEIEELLAQSSLVGRAPDAIFTMLNDADLVYPSIRDEQGSEVVLTKQRFAKFMESPNREVRRNAYHGFYAPYKTHLNTFGAALSSTVNKDLFYARARKFETCLESALHGNNIQVDVYRSLITATEANLEPLHRYIALRKRILGYDRVFAWDTACPLFPDQNYEVPYADACRHIGASLTPLGARYQALVERAIHDRWIDVYETEGKGSGAYSYSTYGIHSYILMNYNDTVDDMFTLTHELGHALHSYLADETQPFAKAGYSIFVAEVASTLNEGLLHEHMVRQTDNDRQRLFLLNRQLDNTVGTFFYQVLLAHFELKIHECVERGEALSAERLSDIYADLVKTYYGPAYTFEELSALKWARIGHFYNAFYVYQYATSYAASSAILLSLLAEETGMVDRYLTMLASGGNDYPIELLKKCGVDMSTPRPVESLLRLFSGQVAELNRLA